MKSFLVICFAIVAAQAAPADEFNSQFEQALSNSKLQPMFQSAAEEAKENADGFMQQYKGITKDIKNTLAEFPNDIFHKTFKSASDKIETYGKNLAPLMQDPNTSGEDKAHQVISSLSPFLDSLLNDFQNAADVIENYLGDANPVIQDGASSLADSASKVVGQLKGSVTKYGEKVKPEVNNIFNSLDEDLTEQQAALQKTLSDSIGKVQSQINEYQPRQ